jgi:hypothetical protein
MATYHGLIKVSCVACLWETTNDSEMEFLNDLDGVCPSCDEQFFRWENQNGSIVVSLTKDVEGLHTYENLVWNQAQTVGDLLEDMYPDFVCGSCGLAYALSAGRISTDSPSHESFVCDVCAVN